MKTFLRSRNDLAKDMFLKKLRDREMKKMKKEMIDACTKGNRKQIIALVKEDAT